MKKLLFLFISIGLFFSCSTKTDGYVIEGTLTGEDVEGIEVYLKKTNEANQLVSVDTATVANGTFIFEGGSVTSPEIHYVFIDKVAGNIPVVVENGEIEIKTQIDSLGYAVIGGTFQNDVFRNFLKELRSLNRRASSMNKDMSDARARRDTVVMNSLREEYFELQEEAKGYEMEFAKTNPNSLISLLIIERALVTKAVEVSEVKKIFETLSPEIKGTTAGKRLQEALNKAENTTIGSKAPNFSAPSPSGEELALHDVLGKVTIVDFWAAWCRPCRAENPNVVKIYNKYRDQGLSIIGVSLDRNADDWKKAIEDDGLTWNHVSNVDYFDEIARLYNVDAIPATFILDENGIIVAKNLRGKSLEDKINELLQ